MGPVTYYILYSINWILTLLPLPVLYIFSDFIFILIYYFPSYRRKVVSENLRNAFPEMSETDRAQTEKKFYQHLADIFVETLKLTHMSSGQLVKRMRVTNPEVLERLYREDRDILAVMGHYGNWEWLQSTIYYTKHQTVSIYKPLQDKRVDVFVRRLRETNGMILTPMSNIIREIIKLRSMNIRAMYGFITDQTPPRGYIRYWTTFLNQDTAVYQGIEKVASKYDMPVVYFNVQKVKRGYYEVTAEVLFEHTSGLSENVITESHVRRLEAIIKERPEYWVWSHRRWKYKRTA